MNYQIKSFKGLFENCGCIEYMYFKKFCRNNINNMSYMFFECSSLAELILSNYNSYFRSPFIDELKSKINKLKIQADREKQFNRQIELDHEIKKLNKELEELLNE
jgi:hypothetical protein